MPQLTHAEATIDNLVFSGDARLRFEDADWAAAAGKDENYRYASLKARLGGGVNIAWFKAFAEGQLSYAENLPRNASGLGAAYLTANEGDTSPEDIFLRRAYLEGKLPLERNMFSATLGRFYYASGAEAKSAHSTLDWLKRNRIANRMIGTFDFSFGRSFDGALLTAARDRRLLSTAFFRPTEGGFSTAGGEGIDDVVVAAVTAGGAVTEQRDAQVFYYFYEDEREEVVKADNRPADVLALDRGQIELHQVGLHWLQVVDHGENSADFLLWAVLQGGKWGTLDHSAGAFALEAGYRFETVPARPWLRGGFNWSSGDSDPADGQHNTFFQLLPTARQYALTPFYNAMNNQDLFAQILLAPHARIELRSDVHLLWLQQEEDLLYSGAGATSEAGFGYSGLSAAGESEVGTLVDIGASIKLDDHLLLSIYYGHVFGGGVLRHALPADENIDYGFLELTLSR